MQTRFRATSLVAFVVLLLPCVARAQSSDDARATFQKAKLATQADSAEDAYLTVALSYPTSPYAAESLLRLGQARLANNDAKQAIVYLQRLLTDYPRSEYRPIGGLWLARAQVATNNPRAACTTIKSALQLEIDSETAALLQTEQTAACFAASSMKASAAPAAPVPSAPSGARFAIQVGAFRERAGARAFARGLEKAGFERVRMAVMPENALFRVRVGQYENGADAKATVAKLKTAGYSAVVVSDRQREKAVKD